MSTTAGFIILLFVGVLCFLGKVQSKSNYTSAETAALKKFRPLVKDVLYADYMNTDEFLVRWLRDKSMDINKANDKLRKSIEWRKHNNMDTIINDTRLEEFAVEFPIRLGSHDKFGSPILIQEFGKWNLRKVVLAGKLPDFRRYMSQMMERAVVAVRDQAQKTGRDITQWILIADMVGYSLRLQGCLACIPLFGNYVETYESNYPETAKNIIIINTPRIFDSILQLVKPAMSPGTRRGFKAFGYDKSEYTEFFFKTIAPDQLSPRYGGTKVA